MPFGKSTPTLSPGLNPLASKAFPRRSVSASNSPNETTRLRSTKQGALPKWSAARRMRLPICITPGPGVLAQRSAKLFDIDALQHRTLALEKARVCLFELVELVRERFTGMILDPSFAEIAVLGINCRRSHLARETIVLLQLDHAARRVVTVDFRRQMARTRVNRAAAGRVIVALQDGIGYQRVKALRRVRVLHHRVFAETMRRMGTDAEPDQRVPAVFVVEQWAEALRALVHHHPIVDVIDACDVREVLDDGEIRNRTGIDHLIARPAGDASPQLVVGIFDFFR